MERCGKRQSGEQPALSMWIEDLYVEKALAVSEVQSPHLVQEFGVLGATTQKHVLPVVYLHAALAVREGESSPAQVWSALHQSHVVTQA